MKHCIKIYIILICSFAIGCSQKNSKSEAAVNGQVSSIPDSGTLDAGTKKGNEIDNIGDFAHLVPIEVVNPKSTNAYEKYGIEFSGNCYACDLAAISINKKRFDIINVCNKDDFYRDEKFSYQSSEKEFIVTTEKNTFILTRIDSAPVYELKIVGEKMALKDKRFSKFYTQQTELTKFKQHDCGEFDG